MAITKEEKKRRSAKEIAAVIEGAISRVLAADSESADAILSDYAKADIKGFMAFVNSRLPKVASIDQDFEKSRLSLTEMMKQLPDTEDIDGARRAAEVKAKQAINERDFLKETDFAQKREIKRLTKKLKEANDTIAELMGKK